MPSCTHFTMVTTHFPRFLNPSPIFPKIFLKPAGFSDFFSGLGVEGSVSLFVLTIIIFNK